MAAYSMAGELGFGIGIEGVPRDENQQHLRVSITVSNVKQEMAGLSRTRNRTADAICS